VVLSYPATATPWFRKSPGEQGTMWGSAHPAMRTIADSMGGDLEPDQVISFGLVVADHAALASSRPPPVDTMPPCADLLRADRARDTFRMPGRIFGCGSVARHITAPSRSWTFPAARVFLGRRVARPRRRCGSCWRLRPRRWRAACRRRSCWGISRGCRQFPVLHEARKPRRKRRLANPAYSPNLIGHGESVSDVGL